MSRWMRGITFFCAQNFTFLGVREAFFPRLRHFVRIEVVFVRIEVVPLVGHIWLTIIINDNTTSKIHCFYFNSIIVPWYHCEFDQESGATAKVVFTEINFSQLSSIIQSNTNVTAVAGVLQCHISDPDKDVNTWKRTTIPWQRGGDVRLCNPHNWIWRGCLVRDVE